MGWGLVTAENCEERKTAFGPLPQLPRSVRLSAILLVSPYRCLNHNVFGFFLNLKCGSGQILVQSPNRNLESSLPCPVGCAVRNRAKISFCSALFWNTIDQPNASSFSPFR